MKNYFFVILCLVVSIFMASCKDYLGMEVEGTDKPNDTIELRDTLMLNDTISIHDTTTVIVPTNPIVVTLWSDKDTVIIKGDTVTIYRDTTHAETADVTESYELASNKVDNGTNYIDIQPTKYLIDGEVVLNTDVNRSAAISNDDDTLFVRRVAALQSTISRPETNSSYDVKGEFDINTGYRNYTVSLNDGSEYAVATEAESASAMYRGEKKNLLYRMVKGIKVLSVKDEPTEETVVKGKTIYRKANRVMSVQVESLNRPLMGPEVVTLDTLVIESSKASYTDGVAEVFVEDGEVEPDPDPDPDPDPVEVTESYELGSNKVDNVTSFVDIQPTSYLVDGTVVLNTDVKRSAAISNNKDTMFVGKVASLQSTVGSMKTNSSSTVKGQFDILTEYRNCIITLNDGSEYVVNAEEESASAMYNGEKKNLLYRMLKGIKVLSIEDELTEETVIKGKKIYRKVNRVMLVQFEWLNRPLIGSEVVTFDTLVIESSKAAYTDGVAEVFVEDGEIEDDGYTIDGEKIEGIIFSYTVSPNKTLKEVLLVRTASYVMPVVSRELMAPVKVSNPKDYNSVAWSAGWVPAYLSLEEGFVWKVEGAVVVSATDATIDWLAQSTGINSISRNDFLKTATFVNEGTTTRVYLGNTLYMVLSK